MAKARLLSAMRAFPLRLRRDKAPKLEGVRTTPAPEGQQRLGITALRRKGPKRVHPGRLKRTVFRALGLPLKEAKPSPKPSGKSKKRKTKGRRRKKGQRNAISETQAFRNRQQELEWKLKRARAWQAEATHLTEEQSTKLQQQIDAMEADLRDTGSRST